MDAKVAFQNRRQVSFLALVNLPGIRSIEHDSSETGGIVSRDSVLLFDFLSRNSAHSGS